MRTLLTLLAALTLSLAVAGSVVKAHGPSAITYVERPCQDEEMRSWGWCDGDRWVTLQAGPSDGGWNPIVSGEVGRRLDRSYFPEMHARQDILQHYSWFHLDWEWDADEDSLSEFAALLMNRFVPADAWADHAELKVEIFESAADAGKRCRKDGHPVGGCLVPDQVLSMYPERVPSGPNSIWMTLVLPRRELTGKIQALSFLHEFAHALDLAINQKEPGYEPHGREFYVQLARVWDEFVGYDLRPYCLFWGVPCS